MKATLYRMAAAAAAILTLAGCSQAPFTMGGPAVAVPNQQAQPAAKQEQVAAAGPVLGTLEIKGVDIGYEPKNIVVDAPGRYTVKFVNTGAQQHDAIFPGGVRILAAPGETKSADINVPADGVEFLCSFPGHMEGGMKGTISVKGMAEHADAGGDHGGPAPISDVLEDPNAPAPVHHDPAAPKLLEGTVHDINLEMTERTMTVAKGFVQEVWTFGDTVPGPVIRVKVGDTVRVHLKNRATNKMAHSIDFHSSMVAWNDEMTSINP
ncbi:MAG TPA: multicopper oxidase domain-containing protein, partial [Roseiflexaceae bacterium]|nr:multicopper oxidase domain-containing protein [Roseiflexaceae bacterium]